MPRLRGQIEITETAWVGRRLGSDRLHQAESDVGSFDTSLDMCRGFATLALDFEFRFEASGKQGYAPLHGRRGVPRNGSMMSWCSGAAGGIASYVLATRGLRILCLEPVGWFRLSIDFELAPGHRFCRAGN